jgi:hypothetical protein
MLNSDSMKEGGLQKMPLDRGTHYVAQADLELVGSSDPLLQPSK